MFLIVAERRVAGQLTRNLSFAQTEALDALLTVEEGTSLSVLAWARQPPDVPDHKALARTIEQLTYLRGGDIWSAWRRHLGRGDI